MSDTVLPTIRPQSCLCRQTFDYDHQGSSELLGSVDNQLRTMTGIAGYVKYAVNPNVAVAGRYEYFNDHDGLALASPALQGNIMNESSPEPSRRTFAGHLISRLEYRHDDSNQNFFQRGGNHSVFVKGQATVDAGLMFVLEPNDTK